MSIVTVTTAASSYNLTTLNAIKLELNINDNSQDNLLDSWISAASNEISNACKRIFASETLTEVFRINTGAFNYYHSSDSLINSGMFLSLTRQPISSITSVVEDSDDALASNEYELDGRLLYRLDSDNDLRRHWIANKVTVVYVAGYTTIPNDLARACILLIKNYKSINARNDLSLRSLEIPGVSTKAWETRNQVLQNSQRLPPEVEALISPYKETYIK